MPHLFVQPPAPDRGLTDAQRRALVALRGAGEVEAATVAQAAGMKPNGAGLALRGLARGGLVARQEGEPALWSVTFAGHALLERMADERVASG